MTVIPFYFRFYICLQNFITIERIIKIYLFWANGPFKMILRGCFMAVLTPECAVRCFTLTGSETKLGMCNSGQTFAPLFLVSLADGRVGDIVEKRKI